MIVQIVKFKSGLADDEVFQTYGARAKRYLSQPGLIDKYYLKFDSGEHGAVYLWESEQALREFRASELAQTIPDAYAVQGAPDVATGEVVFRLRAEPQRAGESEASPS